MKLQNLKTKQWNIDGIIINVRTSADGTICSYDIETNGTITNRHRKYIMKIHTSASTADGAQDTTVGDTVNLAYQVTEHRQEGHEASASASVTNLSHRDPVTSHYGVWGGHYFINS